MDQGFYHMITLHRWRSMMKAVQQKKTKLMADTQNPKKYCKCQMPTVK